MNAVEQQLSTCSDTCMYDHFVLYCISLEQGKYKDPSKTPTGGGYFIGSEIMETVSSTGVGWLCTAEPGITKHTHIITYTSRLTTHS